MQLFLQHSFHAALVVRAGIRCVVDLRQAGFQRVGPLAQVKLLSREPGMLLAIPALSGKLRILLVVPRFIVGNSFVLATRAGRGR